MLNLKVPLILPRGVVTYGNKSLRKPRFFQVKIRIQVFADLPFSQNLWLKDDVRLKVMHARHVTDYTVFAQGFYDIKYHT